MQIASCLAIKQPVFQVVFQLIPDTYRDTTVVKEFGAQMPLKYLKS